MTKNHSILEKNSLFFYDLMLRSSHISHLLIILKYEHIIRSFLIKMKQMWYYVLNIMEVYTNTFVYQLPFLFTHSALRTFDLFAPYMTFFSFQCAFFFP